MVDHLTVVGLGPSGLTHVGDGLRSLLLDEAYTVVVRTIRHPAAVELAELRPLISCDDLYDAAEDFDTVYAQIAERVLEQAGSVIYAVPGSALVGERAVGLVRRQAAAAGIEVDLHPGLSFLDLVYDRVGVDPLASGVQVVDGRDLPDPLPLHLPTIVTQVDRPVIAADLAVELGRVLPDDTLVTLLRDVGGADELVADLPLSELAIAEVNERSSVFVPAADVGWIGLVKTNRVLRESCPWDREQTHHSLVRHLIEETYETVDALRALPDDAPEGEADYGAYAEVEEELGDLLLQVVFHATLAREAAAFDVEEVAEGIRRKLVWRHPHVFGDVVAEDSGTVKRNWERLKGDEKRRDSAIDDIPASLPALARADNMQRRAAGVGFDWDEIGPVIGKVVEELDEVMASLEDPVDAAAEIGDLLFSVVNLARHIGAEPESALRAATDRFARRFRSVEQQAAAIGRPLSDMTPAEMDVLWDHAKRAE